MFYRLSYYTYVPYQAVRIGRRVGATYKYNYKYKYKFVLTLVGLHVRHAYIVMCTAILCETCFASDPCMYRNARSAWYHWI